MNFPHWMVFDIGGEVPVSRFSIWPSVFGLNPGQLFDDRLPAQFSLWGRTDAPPSDNLEAEEGWIQSGDYSVENKVGEQTYEINTPVPIRYLKCMHPVD